MALLSCLAIFSAPLSAGLVPESERWSLWEPHQPDSAEVVDHNLWQQLLDRYLSRGATGVNLFAYGQVSAEDRARLQDYLDSMAAIDPRRLNRAEQMAYWINLYNAVTVAVVLDHYPVKSIRRVKGGLLGLGPWNEVLVTVQGQELTLNDIEHRILRPIFADPRIHYVVNCASIGCPNLAGQAYRGAQIEAQLEQAARDFITHPRGVSLQKKRLVLSSIYDWYGEDFGATPTELLEHLAVYADTELAEQLRSFDGRIRYDYDWRLNAP